MKKLIIAWSVSAVLAVIAVSPLQAQGPPASKVTGGGNFLDIGADSVSGAGDAFSFSVSINPDKTVKKAGNKSPQVVVHMDGQRIRDFWGGPWAFEGDFIVYYLLPWGPADPKPGQAFVFKQEHPVHGWLQVWVYAHDNFTPGYCAADPNWCDWFGVWFEPLFLGNGLPDNAVLPDGTVPPNDDLFTAMGIVIDGNIVDHRN